MQRVNDVVRSLSRQIVSDEWLQARIDKGRTECSICKSSYTKGQILLDLRCDHLFHEECLTEWLRVQSTCPLCRSNTKETYLRGVFGAVLGQVSGADVETSSMLARAASRGDETQVRTLLADPGNDIDSRDARQKTPLMCAAERGHAKVMRLLLDHGADLYAKNDGGRMALAYAAFNGHEQAMELLLSRLQGKVDWKDFQGDSALALAVDQQHVNIVRMLLAPAGLVAVDSTNNFGWTPLFLSSRNGNEPIMKLLLQHGASPNVKSFASCGCRTPLHYAAMNGHARAADILISEGAQVDIRTTDGTTPLLESVTTHSAATITVIETLLRHGADISSARDDGSTALRLAAAGLVEIVKFLLQQPNVAINAKDRTFGLTALSFAAAAGRVENVRLLLQQSGIEVDTQDNNGRTPLSWAAGEGHDDVVQSLLGVTGIQVSLPDSRNRTPIHWAASGKHRWTLIQLLQYVQAEQYSTVST